MADFPSADDWQVFHGETNPAAARVYLRMRLADPAEVDRLRGEIIGPFSRYARTLPATTRFEAVVRGADVMAETVLIDPCFWTPELPYLYRVRLTLEASGQVRWSDERTFGIRRLGVRGGRFVFEGKHWVLRGGMVDTSGFDWDAWREQDLVAFVNEPEEGFCADADQRGVLVAARSAAPGRNLESLLRCWERHPSVAFVLLPGHMTVGPEVNTLCRNAVVVAEMSDVASGPPDWAAAALGRRPVTEVVSKLRSPRLIERPLPGKCAPKLIRAGCDELQRDLARQGQYDGYVV